MNLLYVISYDYFRLPRLAVFLEQSQAENDPEFFFFLFIFLFRVV